MDDDFLGGLGGGGKGGAKEFGRSSAESAIGGDVRGLNLDSVTVITIAAMGAAALIVVAMLFQRR